MPASTWTVDKGDTIWDIAIANLAAYQNPQPQIPEIVTEMQRIIALNLDQMKASPGKGNADLIYAGMELKLNDVPSPGDAAKNGKKKPGRVDDGAKVKNERTIQSPSNPENSMKQGEEEEKKGPSVTIQSPSNPQDFYAAQAARNRTVNSPSRPGQGTYYGGESRASGQGRAAAGPPPRTRPVDSPSRPGQPRRARPQDYAVDPRLR